MYSIGLDIGSTTIKCLITDEKGNILFNRYERHFSLISQKTAEILTAASKVLPHGEKQVHMALSGSAGMGAAETAGIPFVQEVYAVRMAVRKYYPETYCAVELGGEDAKILFFGNSPEVRMNGSCAGGTGAFIDQMATLLNITPDDMNELAKNSTKLYTIASRCGVFAKSDIQPLLNQGADRCDVCASIFHAVVNQTIVGLAQGRKITSNVLYLGGPLTFLSELRRAFDETLDIKGICPENSLYYVSLGTCLEASSYEPLDIDDVIRRLSEHSRKAQYEYEPPLFADSEEYNAFKARHSSCKAAYGDISSYSGKAYLGVDAGSTTIKAVLTDEDGRILDSFYSPNGGSPVPVFKRYFTELYRKYPQIKIAASAATGYGEDLAKTAFGLDFGIVETVAHYTAAKVFSPKVDFIIDIGGQDIKCFKLKNGTVDNIFLNEACSSGCGSFLQTMANTMGMTAKEFAEKGLFAKRPVNLGSRCTVFMNSSVKQAQKDGATVEDISAGLSISVVRNALYKVIRTNNPQKLGSHIVVQGGTFHSDAVLRAFERELGTEVVRPDIAGLMGAYGCAVYAKAHEKESSSTLTLEALESLLYETTNTVCKGCSNHCRLTVNTFDKKRRSIGGNRCDKPVSKGADRSQFNIYSYKLSLLKEYFTLEGSGKKLGIPFGLNFYELLPFWNGFFKALGIGYEVSCVSDRELYTEGQGTIPSDTVCYPAKLIHGHVKRLAERGITTIFYPCMTYNINEGQSDKCYNCPVVAYYPEVIDANCGDEITVIKDYIGIHNRKHLPSKLRDILAKYGFEYTPVQMKKAVDAGFSEYESYMAKIRQKGAEIVAAARKDNMPIIVLAGRPYHVDPEVNHGIDRLITSYNTAVISEDCVSHLAGEFKSNVLNQWTYHSRLYAAASYIGTQPDMQLVQLVSFGCGIDAITTDEVREMLERRGKLYTMIKIDEITNLGTVRIRLRSLFAALDKEEGR